MIYLFAFFCVVFDAYAIPYVVSKDNFDMFSIRVNLIEFKKGFIFIFFSSICLFNCRQYFVLSCGRYIKHYQVQGKTPSHHCNTHIYIRIEIS